MSDPTLVPRDALHGVRVGISVSESADLGRLGLTPQHCELAVAELARSIMIAGGTVVYGGRLVPLGFTDILLDEVRRFREDREALIICLAETEHRKLRDDELIDRQRELTSSAEIVCLDEEGNQVDPGHRPKPTKPVDASRALTAMRRYMTSNSHARVLVGGRLRGYEGQMPGVVEEALLSTSEALPLYVAGGFGGASAAVAFELGRSDRDWVPKGIPDGADEVSDALAAVAEAEKKAGVAPDGLEPEQRRQLAATHRPADIATLVISGLARRGRGR